MFFADGAGPGHWRDLIVGLSGEDPHFWRLSPLLSRLADEGRRFADLDTAPEAR